MHVNSHKRIKKENIQSSHLPCLYYYSMQVLKHKGEYNKVFHSLEWGLLHNFEFGVHADQAGCL